MQTNAEKVRAPVVSSSVFLSSCFILSKHGDFTFLYTCGGDGAGVVFESVVNVGISEYLYSIQGVRFHLCFMPQRLRVVVSPEGGMSVYVSIMY